MINKNEYDRRLAIDIIVTKLGIDLPTPALLQYNIDEIEQTIKNYCNIEFVPKELLYTLVNMVCDLHHYNSQIVADEKEKDDDSGIDIDVSSSGVNSVRVGNTTVSFGSGSDTNTRNRALRSHQANLDQLILNYKDQLNKFRRMVW